MRGKLERICARKQITRCHVQLCIFQGSASDLLSPDRMDKKPALNRPEIADWQGKIYPWLEVIECGWERMEMGENKLCLAWGIQLRSLACSQGAIGCCCLCLHGFNVIGDSCLRLGRNICFSLINLGTAVNALLANARLCS